VKEAVDKLRTDRQDTYDIWRKFNVRSKTEEWLSLILQQL